MKPHESYYMRQIGHGSPYLSGAAYQKGYGLGGIFSSIAKTIMPLIKSSAKTVGKQVLRSGVGFASDVLKGKNAKQAAIDRAKSGGSHLLNAALKKRKRPAKKLQKKKRRRYDDIFG